MEITRLRFRCPSMEKGESRPGYVFYPGLDEVTEEHQVMLDRYHWVKKELPSGKVFWYLFKLSPVKKTATAFRKQIKYPQIGTLINLSDEEMKDD